MQMNRDSKLYYFVMAADMALIVILNYEAVAHGLPKHRVQADYLHTAGGTSYQFRYPAFCQPETIQ